MDAGFFSENNTRSMMEKKMDFMMRVPADGAIYHNLVESAADIENPGKAVKYGNKDHVHIIFPDRVRWSPCFHTPNS